MAPRPRVTVPPTPSSKPGPAAGKAPGWNATAPCAGRFSPACNRAVPRNRWRGRLALEAGRPVISHETIYRFIYAQLARTKNYNWRHYLPRAKSKRGRRGRKGGSPASFIQDRVPLSQRPAEADDRQTPGHWEADLMLFGNKGPALLVMTERHSRLMSAVRLAGKAAEPVALALAGALASFPPQWRRTVAFDNGTEFAPPLPASTSWASKPSSATCARPGRRAGWKTASAGCAASCPARRICRRCPGPGWVNLSGPTTTPRASAWATLLRQRFNSNHLLHLKCESTFPLSRE